MALIAAGAEGSVSNSRLREISTDHPADIGKVLASLVRDGLLRSEGIGRGMVYFLPWKSLPATLLFDQMGEVPTADTLSLTPELSVLTPELPDVTIQPCLDWEQLPPALQSELTTLAEPVSARKRVDPALLRATVHRLCQGRYIGPRVLARVLHRDPEDLRKRTLMPMVRAAILKTAFASMTDPRQAYTAVSKQDTQ